jgi:hypothetical protein
MQAEGLVGVNQAEAEDDSSAADAQARLGDVRVGERHVRHAVRDHDDPLGGHTVRRLE